MFLAVVAFFLFRKLHIEQWPQGGQIVAGTLIALIAVVSFAVTTYVLLRYPYLSLVETADKDFFQQQLQSPALIKLFKYVALAGLLVVFSIMLQKIWKGDDHLQNVSILAYTICMLLVVTFFIFVYDPITYPTTATFIRCTLGIGILFLPLFVPILIVGGIRCRRLLV
jgi:hypothetical protein